MKYKTVEYQKLCTPPTRRKKTRSRKSKAVYTAREKKDSRRSKADYAAPKDCAGGLMQINCQCCKLAQVQRQHMQIKNKNKTLLHYCSFFTDYNCNNQKLIKKVYFKEIPQRVRENNYQKQICLDNKVGGCTKSTWASRSVLDFLDSDPEQS